MRNAMDAQEVAVGWWPGDARYGRAAFYAYAHPAPEGFADGELSPAAARWDGELGEYVLDWDDVRASPDPHARRARVRPLGLPPRLRRVRVGPRPGGQRRGHAAAGEVMRVAVIGASGWLGGCVTRELLSRGHEVTRDRPRRTQAA